eukprot:CAMPEP_0184657158 /NCGR_PEP_ID=MMETSP0308-20130426/17019_1 /TAXON_ID=38269 /ORGANISM="Gloeochaete witrockiana, Strain SAG 46.84" /LENGTH=264 /DNA_ID=CAMNT_0027094593 /DNA_START=91 /DNA_END=885 /DNA_ORIENTATION=+
MASGYVDTHCHVDAILERLKVPLDSATDLKFLNFPATYDRCITVACEVESFEPTMRRLINIPDVYAAFGIHPHDASVYNDSIESRIIEAMSSPKVVAWGECGLDYHYDKSPRDVQQHVFARQIKQAVKLGKPIVVHTREAEEDTLRIMKEHVPQDWRVHVHCFTDSLAFAKNLLAHFSSLCIGFTGVITFKNAQDVQKVVSEVPLERILLETDGPFMAPIPHRGKPSHPGYIPFIAAKIAEIKGVNVETVFEQCRKNTLRIYGI